MSTREAIEGLIWGVIVVVIAYAVLWLARLLLLAAGVLYIGSLFVI